MSEQLEIEAHSGPYRVDFTDSPFHGLDETSAAASHVVLDARVGELYAEQLAPILPPSVLRIDASEQAKSLDRFPGYVEQLVDNGIRRGHELVAIGGGVVQDITCFLAATLLRGVAWRFHPTTLLAQADSCIGSKSSINVGRIKNVLGTFTPPTHVTIAPTVLSTLPEEEVRSGIGEMLKVHVIDGPASFDALAADYRRLASDHAAMKTYIRRSLEIKKRLIEIDEFDEGPRNVMNYGHSFGHAIESATDFGVPHGIAVTIGMDMANWVAMRLGETAEAHYERMHPTMAANYAGYERTAIPLDALLEALGKDKKNLGSTLRLILPGADGRPRIGTWPNDERFRAICEEYLARLAT